nr:hypothetical protein [Tanacetum cinerariifolium]
MTAPTFTKTHNLIAFLTKLTESEGFEQIIDFLNESSVRYALIASPTIRTSCIKQFWSTTKVKTVNDEVRVHALMDAKRVNIKESSIRCTLKLDDEEEAGVPFYMFPRFVQLIVDHQLGDMSHHQDIYDNPLLTKKLFANMKRVGTGFSMVITPLFKNILVPAFEEVGQAQDDVSIPTEPSTSKHHKKHKSKKHKPIAPKVPSPEPSPEHQLPLPSNDPILIAKDSLKLQELMDLCTRLSNKVLDLESKFINIKSSFTNKIEKLKDRVHMLEEENRILKEKSFKSTKIDVVSPVEDKEESFKQGRMIAYMDEDVKVSLEEAQAKAYKLDLQHSEKVLSMQDIDEEEPAEVEEVLEVVTAAKLITEVVTIAEPTTTATQAPTVSAPRRRKGVVIQDPEETVALVIMHTEVQSAKAYKLDLQHSKKVLSMQDIDEEEPAEVEEVLEVVTATKLITEKVEEEVTVQEKEIEEEGNKRQGESLEQEIAKKQRMDEEAEELKRHMQIVSNDDDDDVYTEATPLASKIMFEKPNIEANVWKYQKSRYGLAKKYPLTHFTLEQRLKNVRLELKEESEMSLELLRLNVTAVSSSFCCLTSVTVKKVNDVTRLQALVDKKRVIITEAIISDALRLDDVEGINCLPNEEIFTELARMGYEKPSIKLTFYKAFFSCRNFNFSKYIFDSFVRNVDSSTKFYMVVHVDDVPAVGVAAEGAASVADDEFPTVVDEPSDKIAQALEITKLKQRVKKLERRNKASKLRRLQKIKESIDVQGRQVESQAQIYQIDLEHVDKVLSIHDDEVDPAKLQEVVEVVTTAKLITKVFTVASATITTAAPQLTTAVAPTLTTTPSATRKRKRVVIKDPKETATPSAIIHSEAKSKDKGKGILVEEPKPLKKQAQIEQDETYARELEAELILIGMKFKMDYFKGITYDDIRLIFEKKFNSNVSFLQKTKEQMEEEDSRALKRLSESQEDKATKKQKLDEEVTELKRHLQIVPNDEDDVYTEATPLARKVSVVDYEIYNEKNKPYYKIIRADGSPQLFLSFLSLLRNFDREDLEVLWELVKERFASSKPKNFSGDFLLTTLTYMFEKPGVQAQVLKNQRTVYGLAKFPHKLFVIQGFLLVVLDLIQDALDQTHSGPSTRVASSRLVYPSVMTPRYSKEFRRCRSAPLSTPYPLTKSESSLDSFFERSLDSSSLSVGPSRKRRRSPTTSVSSSTLVLRSIAPTHVDLLPPRKREDEEELKAEASAGGTMEIAVDPLVTGGISESTREDVPDLEGTLYDIVHYMSEVPLDRITKFKTAQRQLEAGQLTASKERVGLTDRIRRLGRENLRVEALLYIERDRVDSLRHHMVLLPEEFR